MRIQTVNIIKSIVETLSVEFQIDNATTIGSNFLLETKCTWWLSIGCTVTINSIEYTITDFVINESITVSGSTIPTVNSFTIPAPNFLNGTLKMAQNEVDAIYNKEELTPFIYLFEVIRDRKNTDDESMIDRETDLRLFFLNSVDTGNWLTEDHYKYFVDPMQQMVDLFIKNIENNKLFTDNLQYDCLPLLNVSENGNQDEGLFDCNLSGIELKLFAEIREDLSCQNKCNCLI